MPILPARSEEQALDLVFAGEAFVFAGATFVFTGEAFVFTGAAFVFTGAAFVFTCKTIDQLDKVLNYRNTLQHVPSPPVWRTNSVISNVPRKGEWTK